MILLFALVYNSNKERMFMIEKVGKGNSLTIVMTIANSIYAFSFFFRLCFNIVLLSDHHDIVRLQCDSCMYDTAGYALLVFSVHFFCELLPLSAIFTLQLITVIKAEHN